MCFHLPEEAYAPQAEMEWISEPILLGAYLCQASCPAGFLLMIASRVAKFCICVLSWYDAAESFIADKH